MVVSQPYLDQPPITLICPPELKMRLMRHLSDWASDPDGQLDPGVTVRVPRRDRDDIGSKPGDAFVTIVPGVFVLYGDPPFTGEGGAIAWWNAPRAYFLSEADLDAPASRSTMS